MLDETSQPTPSENPALPEPTLVPENIPEVAPTEAVLPEEIKSESVITTEPTPNQEIPTPKSNSAEASLDKTTSQISTDPINPNITIEKTLDTVTITEVMQPPTPVPEVAKGTFDTKNFLASLLPKLKEKLSFRTEKRLSKIMELARKNGEIQNDEVEKLLLVSDASATRYLEKLVKRGSLRISGPKNHSKYLPN